jgi:transcription antitermination factor NusG
VPVALFPGYVFCRFAVDGRLPILKTPGVIRIAGTGGIPTPVEEQEIFALQRVVQSQLDVLPHPFLHVGRRVQIRHGPLCGVEGLIADVRGRDRLILSVGLLQRSIAIDVDSASVIPIHMPPPRRQENVSRSAPSFS